MALYGLIVRGYRVRFRSWGVGIPLHQRVTVSEHRGTESDARATTGQHAKTIETWLSVRTRDGTESPTFAHVHSGCTAVRGPRSARSSYHTRMVSSCRCRLSSLVRRPDHNWQPYMCRSQNSRSSAELASLTYCQERFVACVHQYNSTPWRLEITCYGLFSMKNIRATAAKDPDCEDSYVPKESYDNCLCGLPCTLILLSPALVVLSSWCFASQFPVYIE